MSVSSHSVVRASIALLVVGFLALVGIVGMTIWLAERAQVYFRDVIEARDARSSAVELRNAVQAAESSQRGFLLTGNEIYLAPYDLAKTVAQRELETLKRTLAAYRQMELPLQRLTALVGEKYAEMDRTIALKRERRDAEALALTRTNRGKALMDEANVFFSGVIRAADDRLTTGVGEQNANATRLRWVSIVGGIIIIMVVGGATIMVVRFTRELTRARDEVESLAANLEQRVADRTADLTRANDEIQRFAHLVTHDLRAPLVNIMGFTTELESGVEGLRAWMEKSAPPGDAADPAGRQAHAAATVDLPEAIGFIRTSTRKMEALISAILKLSREGQRILRPELVDLEALLRSCAAAIRHQVNQVQGEIAFDLRVPALETDRLSLEQVLGNLLDNAVKYHSADRELRIVVRTTEAPDDKVAIEVADNGRGIASTDSERVFELFRRSGVQDRPGEGVGLAYVRTIVRNLGGDITVTSTLGEGATFRVVLPRRLERPEAAAA
ncbi:MAG TPA: ATP-binding protein [Microvirga sp.]|jgi:signal transduction histidine kinase|nr:ATP-binding protein [Microvirga sp.]